MRCLSCNHENRAERKFCGQCGAALALACATCGTPNDAGEKFCGECGVPLGAAAPQPSVGGNREGDTGSAPAARAATDTGARKVVTIVFADLAGSTALHERLDAESARRLMERYYEALRAAVDAHGGAVVKLLGDGVMAVFGLKQVAEDDALRAVRAGAAMQEAFRALVRAEAAVLGAVGLRVAVNTGEVVVSGARDDVIGDPVNVAARLQEQGSDGDVVLGEATRRLVATRVTLAPLGSITLKGRAEAVAAYRLVSLDPPAGATAAPFVGRDVELVRLEAVYDAAVTTPATRLAVLLGSPGLGKSRLIDELAHRHLEDATILGAHCDAAGGATFAPLAQALRALLGLDDGAVGEPVRTAVAAALPAGDEGERVRIAGGIDGLLTGAPTSPEETFFVVRRFLAGLASVKPLVLVIDDLHWAEPLLLDLVEHLVQWGSGVPLFVLVGARPELRELRSSLVTTGGLVADVVTLGGLDAGAAMRLAANVIGAADLPAAVAAKVLATSEGNPLFVGELVRMLVQEGALTKDCDRWIVGAGLAALEMPPTIHALLAARIERLRPEERAVLERAAVVGRHFSRSAVAALLSRNGTELDARLESLRRSELIERDTGWLLGEPALRFHHVLIRDAAYRRLLKGTRAELHGRLADWIEARVGDAPEHDEMIGWHLEQAHQLLRELGPLDAAGIALGERAARRLAAAGRRALARDDVSLAAGLLGRALDRLTPESPERADLVLDWCEALLSAGDVSPAADAITELDRVAADSPRLRAWHTCFAGQLTVLTAPEALHATSERVGAAARELAALDDAAGEAKAHFVHAQALARLGKVGACEAALDQALAAARRAGDRRRANAVLAGAPLAALWGPSPVTRASGRCLDVVRVLRITQGAPAVEAVALSCQGVLEALRGRTEAARRMLASSRAMVEELGISHRLYETDVFAGRIDLLEGDAPAAERALRAGYEGLRDLGLGIDAARAAALLGRALLAQDRAAEAETLSHESEALAGDDLQAAIAWRGVRAEALARRGDHAGAIALAEASVAIAAATDALLDHADARLALAAALRAGGRPTEADAEERRAFELWEAKGATVLAERARQSRPPVASLEGPREDRAASSRPVPRRVHANAASALAARFQAAFTAGNADAVAALWTDSLEVVDHANGATYDRDGHLASIRRLRRARDPEMRFEPLATLGASLCLTRRRIASKGIGGGRFDVGESEHEVLVLFEVDEPGSCHRIETFAADHLGDAIARLYQRYAEGLAQGPERERTAVAARAVAFMLTPVDAPDLMQLYAQTYEDIDHRSVGYGAVSFDEARTNLRESFRELVDGLRYRVDDVLALDPNGFVRKTTASGVWRDGGGTFERTVCTFSVFGPDGRVTRHESFDPDREVEVLARFDALTAGARPHQPVKRRVRPNVATATAARFDAAIAAHDDAGLAAVLGDALEVVDHPNGAVYGTDGVLESFQRLLRMDEPRMRHEPLATLGESFGLFRRRISARGGRLDVGEYERDEVLVYEVDADERFRHVEAFAAEHLRAAIVRLYERYAESLPDGPVRTRASGTTRTLATLDGPLDADRIARGFAPSFECIDHRTLGTWSAHGMEEWLTHWREQAELAAGFTVRDDDVLALEPTAMLVRDTYFGSSRASGGYFENVVLGLNVFGPDGLITLSEVFEPDHEAEALARFDALTAAPAPKTSIRRRVRPNAATRTFAAIEAAFARRDLAAVDAVLGDPLETIEHPTGTTYGRDGQLESSRRMMRMPDLDFRIEPLATLGDSLCLARRVVGASGTAGGRFDVGEYEIESIVLNEVDAAGRLTSSEVFASDHLCQAIARLYARYAESLPDGPARERATAMVRLVHAVLGPISRDRIGEVLGQDLDFADHRRLGLPSSYGRDGYLQSLGALFEATDDLSNRLDDILALGSDAFVFRLTNCGTDRNSGGVFERPLLFLAACGVDGLAARWEFFDVDREADAVARFDARIGGAGEATPPVPAASPFTNAATRLAERFVQVSAARDWQSLADLFAPSLRFDDRRPLLRMQLRKESFLEQYRVIFDVPNGRWITTTIATRGEGLVLARMLFQGDVAGGGGALEIDHLAVLEVGDDGRWETVVLFEPADLDDAYAELDARFAAGDAAGCLRAWEAPRSFAAAWNARDFDALLAIVTPDYVGQDHRRLLWGSMLSDPAVWIRSLQIMVEMAPDFRCRIDHVVRLAERGALIEAVEMGTRDGGPFETRYLWVTEVDAEGRMPRFDLYDLDQIDQARARFAELSAPAPCAEPFANAASATDAELFRCFNTRDWAGVLTCAAPELVFDERRRLVRNTCGREVWLEQFRLLFDVPASRFTTQLVATRGERLSLSLHRFTGEVAYGGGPLAMDDHLALHEVDGDERIVAILLFDLEDTDAAYAELDARYEAGEGAARPPLISAYMRAIATRDWNAAAAMCAPEFVEYDHRPLALFAPTQGGEAWAQSDRVLIELAPDTMVRIHHVRFNRRGALGQVAWSGSRDGSDYEIPLAIVIELDEHSKFVRSDMYDPEQLDEARARFAELAAPAAPSVEPFANAATCALRTFERCWGVRDWNGVRATYHSAHRMDDRRRLMRLAVAGDDFFANERMLFDDTASEWQGELLATRGERLALFRVRFTATVGSSGPMEVEALDLVEVDAAGLRTALVVFDPDALDAAYAELDACFEAAEGTPHMLFYRAYQRAFVSRDWDAIAALYPPTFVEHDHRTVAVLGTTRGAEAWMQDRALIGLAPDIAVRLDHLRISSRGRLFQVTWMGSRDGAHYEIPFVVVTEVDAQGTQQRSDLYDPEQMDQARARFAELAAPARTADRFANAATRTLERGTAVLGARDWEGFAALFSAEVRVYDRTSFGQFEANAVEWLAGFRQMVEMTLGTPTPQVLATRGDRLVLGRALWRGAAGDVGPSEVEWLLIIEVDDRGDHLALVSLNPSELDAAYAELDARWRAGEATAHPRVAAYQAAFDRGVAHRDWDALAALHDSTLVARDHRPVGWDVLRGPVAYIGALRAMVDLAPDALGRVDHIRTSERGLLTEVVWVGTRDGGAFESPLLWVVELDAEGLAQRLDLYDPHHLEAARARFDEIKSIAPPPTSAAHDRLAAIVWPSAAAVTMERWQAAFEAGLEADDWGAIRGLCAPEMVFEDRQRQALVSGDAELMIASARERARTGARPEAQLVGTAGDRVVIVRMLWSGGPPGGRFEIEYFSVIEVDEAGLLTAIIFFDFDDPRAAQREAWARWAAIDPAAAPWVTLLGAAVDGFDAHDRERLRAIFADDIVVDDHRRTGFGLIEGVDAYLESLAVLWDLAPDQRMEAGWFWPAVERHGVVTLMRRFGTLADGGAFEREYLWLSTATGGRITRLELLEVEDLDRALARLAELRPDPLRIPPNAATRWVDRWQACGEARDWEGLERLYGPTAMFDDRRRLLRMTGDRAMAIANARLLSESGRVRLERTLLATAGDRLALERWSWGGGRPGADFAVDTLAVTEVDANGLGIAFIGFDLDDRAAASAELFERYVASGAEGLPPETIALARAFNSHDLERMRALLPAEFYLDDRRRTGVGRMEGVDAYLASLAALWALSEDLRSEALYTVASAEHGRLMVAHWFGTNTEGGDFEAVYVTIGLLRDGRPVGLEIFELDDLDAAQARFEELRPDPLRVPPRA